MRALLLVLTLLSAAPLSAQDDGGNSIQPHLFDLHLDDSLREVRRHFPPLKKWPATVDKRRGVTRYRVESGDAKGFPPHLRTLYLGFHRGDLVEIEGIYDDDYSRRETYERLAGEYELLYGRPHRSGDRFWWDDGSTVLRVFPAELPAAVDGAILSSATVPSAGATPAVVAWRTGVQIFRRAVFSRE